MIAQNAIIRIEQFIMSTRGDRKVCYIVHAQQAAPNPGSPLGSPVDIRMYADPLNETDSSIISSGSNGSITAVPKSDGFFSLRSKPKWQNGYRDSAARQDMIDNL